ncbi:MAG: aldo/keto reductase [Oligosphaeraceae bacterium]
MDDILLRDGHRIPALGFGVFQIPPGVDTERAVLAALEAGYRHIDTAAAYQNEGDVGRAVRASGLPREQVYITSKLWLQDYGYQPARKAIDTSLKTLGLDYIDLYLLHQPYLDIRGAWRAMEESCRRGDLRSLGISNFTPRYLEEFLPGLDQIPVVNQVECNPFWQQLPLRKRMAELGMVMESWFPLAHGGRELLENPVLKEIAQAHERSVAQVILRWHCQEGLIPLPKTTNPRHLRENLALDDFTLSPEEMARIQTLDTGKGYRNPEDPGIAEHLLAKYRIHP